MKLTPDQLQRGLAASYRLRDSGDPKIDLKPVSFTGNPSAHVRVIGEAILEATLIWEHALQLIRGEHGCEHSTAGIGACYREGRTPDAKYLAERCCTACVADAALKNGPTA